MNKAYLLAATLLVSAVVAPVSADVMAVTFTAATGYYWSNGTGNYAGFSFTPTQDLTLTNLGYWQSDPAYTGRNPNTVSHNVAIYSGDWTLAGGYTPATAVLVASAIVAPGGTGIYNWQTPTQGAGVTLLQGVTYTLSAGVWTPDAEVYGTNYDAKIGCEVGPTAYTGDLGISTAIGLEAGSSGQHYGYDGPGYFKLDQSLGGMAPASFAGNFQYTVADVPEPASLSLLALGAAGLLLRRKK